ncbi:MAG: dihydropteroate synthase [Actinobacteria bacterium]|nr:MAG: dihydropteroate synthase [Actinomycetota bacterium]
MAGGARVWVCRDETFTLGEAVAHGARLVDEGADLVDVGGESTRPGSDPVEVDEELRRVVPVIEGLAKARPGTPISVDTRKPEVAIAALDAGACVVNDITAGRDAKLLEIVTRTGAGIVLMHMLGEPKTMQDDPRYDDVVAEVNEFLRERIEAAVFAGIPEERVCVDPGIGFGKTVEHNLALLRAVPALRMLGAAVMVGASRKGFIGTLTGVEDPAARLEGSLAVVVLAAAHGADLVRVHDVEATVRALKVADAVVREPQP